jgi:single-strand DNA-binding protein
MSFAQATILGNVGNDPRTNSAGAKSVVSFSIAVNRIVKGERTTMWVTVSCWDERKNKTIESFVRKGSQVMIQGFPSVRTYKNKTGETVSSLEVDISFGTIQLVGPREDRDDTPAVRTNGANVDPELDNIPF